MLNSEELKPLPCPFCGSDKVVVEEGSTFRWVFACCDNCDAKAGEVRKQTVGAGTPQEWHEAAQKRAIEEWNKRAQLAQPEPDELGEIIPADEEQLKRIAKLVEPEPEPVAWQVIPDGVSAKPLTEMKAKHIIDRDGFVVGGYILDRETDVCLVHHSAVRWMKYDELFQILHVTAPPQREWQGLTDEERAEAWAKTKGDLLLRLPPFSLAIEAKLKEKNT